MIETIKSALESRDRARVNAAIAEALRQDVPLGTTWRPLAATAERNGEISLALKAIDALERSTGVVTGARMERAAVLARAGRDREALAIVESISGPVGSFEHHYLVGTLAANIGAFDRAKEALRAAVRLRPQSGQAWFALATIDGIDPDIQDDFRAQAGTMRDAAAEEAGAYFNTLGRLLHRDGDHQGAFEAYTESASRMRSVRPFDPRARANAIANLTAGWDRAAFDRFSSGVSVDGGPGPLFVTGLPRSGTTLTEQILLSHSSVKAGAEVEFFPILSRDCGSAAVSSLDRFIAQHGSLQPLRTLYLHLMDERFPGATGRIVDKSVLASAHLGLLAALFPDSPIVWLRRDPADNAWSLFSSFFLRGLNWTWSLADIGEVMSGEDRLFDHWTNVLGDRITVLDYQSLVSDPEAQIHRIDEACGLAFEPAQLEPHRSDRGVTTASLAQVRQPINKKGLGSSTPYQPMMADFFERYAAR